MYENRNRTEQLRKQKTENNMKTRVFLTVIALMMATFMLAGATEVNARKVNFASSLENEMDPVMKIENWMVNSHFWNTADAALISRDYDAALLLEAWMTNLNSWDAASLTPVEVESPMELETWMSGAAWDAAAMTPVEVENPLELEAWMTGLNWDVATHTATENESPMVLEAWMTSPSAWNGTHALPTAAAEEPALSLEPWMTTEIYWSQPESR